jgi:hypothetical protein
MWEAEAAGRGAVLDHAIRKDTEVVIARLRFHERLIGGGRLARTPDRAD